MNYYIERKFSQKPLLSYRKPILGKEEILEVLEDTEMVDGIGGTTWEGALILCHLLDYLSRSGTNEACKKFKILELGGGTGITGLWSSMLGFPTVLTDRESDLIRLNLQRLQTKNVNLSLQTNVENFDWSALEVFESEDASSQTSLSIFEKYGSFDLILGAEITCLSKQQDYLINIINEFTNFNQNAVILLTFDGLPDSEISKYERSFLAKMNENKYMSARVNTSSVVWDKSMAKDQKLWKARIDDITSKYQNDLSWLDFPVINNDQIDEGQLNPKTSEKSVHHVIAFFKPSAINTCSCCHKQFFSNPFFNSKQSCRFHQGFYVCRRHPAELRCSIDGLGDNLGYYGNGKEGWEAKFWDCCGSEDPNEPGCKFSCHSLY